MTEFYIITSIFFCIPMGITFGLFFAILLHALKVDRFSKNKH